jgi:hypothetical protein
MDLPQRFELQEWKARKLRSLYKRLSVKEVLTR